MKNLISLIFILSLFAAPQLAFAGGSTISSGSPKTTRDVNEDDKDSEETDENESGDESPDR